MQHSMQHLETAAQALLADRNNCPHPVALTRMDDETGDLVCSLCGEHLNIENPAISYEDRVLRVAAAGAKGRA